MYQRCKSQQNPGCPTIALWAKIVLLVVCTGGETHAQVQHGSPPSGVSSDAFLNSLPAGSLNSVLEVLSFPADVLQSKNNESEEVPKQAAYSTDSQNKSSAPVVKAQFESPAGTVAIGSGVAMPYQGAHGESANQSPSPLPNLEKQPPKRFFTLRDWLGLDAQQPNFSIEYESIGFRRSNDSVGPYSQSENLDRFDKDIAGRYTFSRLFGTIEGTEFKFTGPFRWDRQSSAIGPIDANLPTNITATFNGSDLHRQSHQVGLSSYELNRFASGDEMSKVFCGLRFFDIDERFGLDSTKGVSVSTMRLSTDNLLAGGQIGLNLFRPLSQRFSIGFTTSLGVYGNFASGSLSARDGVTTLIDASDSGFRVTSMFEGGGLVKYRVWQHLVAFGGYEWWYFPGLATVAHQQLEYPIQPSQFALRMQDDQLFHGWSAGLSARF